MKNITTLGSIFLLIISLLVISCKHKPSNGCKEGYTKAIITGYDMRKCACCGGLMLTFSNDSKPYSSDFVLIEGLPNGTSINESTTFPLNVCVKYEKQESSCGTVKIKVTDLVVKN